MLAGDLGASQMRVAVFSHDGSISARARERTPADDPSALVRLARTAVASAPVAPSAFVLGVAGPVSHAEGRPLRLPNLPAWEGHISARSLADAIGLPVLIANDADLAALGEHRFGAGRGTRDMLYVTVSTGVGGGVILNGQLLHGARSLAEIGWMTVDRRAGTTVEDTASGTALGRLLGLPGEVAEARARAGDAAALAAFREIADALAAGIMNAVFCFMPERVVIGGGVAQAGELLLAPIREYIAGVGPRMSIEPQIVVAEGGDDAGLLGAFALWQDIAGGRGTLAYAHPSA